MERQEMCWAVEHCSLQPPAATHILIRVSSTCPGLTALCVSRQESVHLPDSSITLILLDCLGALEMLALGHKHLWLT